MLLVLLLVMKVIDILDVAKDDVLLVEDASRDLLNPTGHLPQVCLHTDRQGGHQEAPQAGRHTDRQTRGGHQ